MKSDHNFPVGSSLNCRASPKKSKGPLKYFQQRIIWVWSGMHFCGEWVLWGSVESQANKGHSYAAVGLNKG